MPCSLSWPLSFAVATGTELGTHAGFRVLDVELRVQDLGLRIQSVGFRV